MVPFATDPVPWLLAGLAFVAVGALIAALLAILRLDPLIGGSADNTVRRGDASR